MKVRSTARAAVIAAMVLTPLAATAQTEITGKVVGESRLFSHSGADPRQTDEQFSLALEAEFYHSWNDDLDSIVFKPFYRFDSADDERQHGDIRELLWLHVGDDWELRTGLGKVYWGVTESQHLVDIINQTDRVEAVDGEQKLGQPMVHLSLIKDWGTVDAFVLPGFRESRFAGLEGRFRPSLAIEDGDSQFESSADESHVDFALRWSHTIEDWDVGLSYFNGTNRDADFLPVVKNQQAQNQQVVLNPYYAQMQQVGIDVQATLDSWLWKVEAIYRAFDAHAGDDFAALTAGFEYTIVGIYDSVWDLGLLTEYQFDQRDGDDGGVVSPGQNDLFFGGRIAFNDADGTELLMGLAQDLEHGGSRSGLIEASSRINDNWKWRVDAWMFQSNQSNEVGYTLRRDDFIQFSLEYYF